MLQSTIRYDQDDQGDFKYNSEKVFLVSIKMDDDSEVTVRQCDSEEEAIALANECTDLINAGPTGFRMQPILLLTLQRALTKNRRRRHLETTGMTGMMMMMIGKPAE